MHLHLVPPHTYTHCTGPGLAQDGISTGELNSATTVSGCSHLEHLPLGPPLSGPSQADGSYRSSSVPSAVSPSLTPNPKVYLTEGMDPAVGKVEVLLSVDDKTLQLKPMSHYLLEVPPQQETVTLRLNTFGKSK